MKRIVLIGDSIRLNYQPLVVASLAGEAEVWGPVDNGGTSANVLRHLKEWVLDHSPDILHLNCGLHDIRYDGDATQPRVSIEDYADNLEQIFTELAATRSQIIWATTTPVIEARHQANRPSRRYEIDVARYNLVAWNIAGKHGAIIDDLNWVVTEAGADSLLKQDGVHFSDAGYALLADRVATALRQVLQSD